ncbi:mitochondrial tRNA-specific 2-thiouridylase 1-like isoform X2 [Paramacrobiotus metropolitanus]|uniref:mitochondrial tRNA-specific 2-thiouridylase 1-like isoform X2 n=1 Tax=Paramacrobiotus metropolitanus TaxID=2943436 RepID=UPI0024460A93|nr:mitochondrial tRNA-specific 2-thiouridylase 1-like isoform X2 [Paramacrobiotus metropolitanus]
MLPIKRVVCGVSGGVDSCISALILKRKGFDVIGAFMRNWDSKDESGQCTLDKDCEDAENICRRLEIPFHEVNFVKEYWNDVFTPLLHDYQSGLTPNPDILCNRHVKFKCFLNYAREKHGADAIATGHYAQTSAGPFLEEMIPGKPVKLFKGNDPIKDQTLFLSQISQDAIRHTMFPVGGMLKKHSTGICFIGKRNFADFMREYSHPTPGRFIDVDSGEVVGRHDGVQFFTIGQRALIGGRSGAYYIAHKNSKTNDMFVALNHDNPALFSKTCSVSDMHWISGSPPPSREMECDFRFQHANPVVPCKIAVQDNPACVSVTLRHRLYALTLGQYAVFYNGNECIGSGRITSTAVSEALDEKFKKISSLTYGFLSTEKNRASV